MGMSDLKIDESTMWRGHEIEKGEGNCWYYVDTQKLVSKLPNRDCGHCGKSNTNEGYDRCLGTLPNVMNACCGHGVTNAAYVQFYNGTIISGVKACKFQQNALNKSLIWEVFVEGE